MKAPVCYQEGPRESELAAAGVSRQERSERDEVWERKREAFMRQRPASPPKQQLSHAAGLPHAEGNHHGFGAPTPGPSPTALPPQHAYQSEHRHEQQNDPNFAQVNTHKTQGYCVLKPPGGHSSIDLAWNEDSKPQARPAPAEPKVYASQDRVPRESVPSIPSRASPHYHQANGILDSHSAAHHATNGHGNNTMPPSHEQQHPIHGNTANNGYQESVQRVNSSPYAWDGSAAPGISGQEDDRRRAVGHNAVVGAPAKYGAATAGHAPVAASAPLSTGSNIFGAPSDGVRGDAAPRIHNMAHGVRQNPESANRFAVGSSQNVGNCITGRSTTRVAAPPGGFSNFTLG